MNHRSDDLFDPRVAEWLEDGPDRAPSHVMHTLVSGLPSIPQRRSWRLSWRSPLMPIPKIAAFAAASALVLIVGLAAFALLTGRMPSVGGPLPTPSASPTAAPTASASPAPTAAPTAASTPTAPASTVAPLTITSADVGKALPPGTYTVSDFAAPLSVTLPAGWKANELSSHSFSVANNVVGGVNLFMAVMDKAYPDPCNTSAGPRDIGLGVDAALAALSSLPGFDVADVKDATVGGASGKTFTISNSIDVAAARCSGDMLPIGTYDKDGEQTDIAMFGGETDRFWVVDASGTTVLIAVTDNQVATVQPVLDSISFEPAASN